jgi:hypothetical protein
MVSSIFGTFRSWRTVHLFRRRRNAHPSTSRVVLAILVMRKAAPTHRAPHPFADTVDGMAREKVTITADRRKLDSAMAATGARSTSDAIDMALDTLLRADRIRRDVEAYRELPPTSDETAIARTPRPWADLTDDTDWEAVYSGDTT